MRRVHVRSKLVGSKVADSERTEVRLAKVVVLSLVSGFVNEGSVLEVIPSVLTIKMAGPIVSLNETSFIIPFKKRNEVRDVVKLGTFDIMAKDG